MSRKSVQVEAAMAAASAGRRTCWDGRFSGCEEDVNERQESRQRRRLEFCFSHRGEFVFTVGAESKTQLQQQQRAGKDGAFAKRRPSTPTGSQKPLMGNLHQRAKTTAH